MGIPRAYTPSGGGTRLKDKDESNGPASSGDALRHAVGANATLELGVDKESGRATETLGSVGGGSTPGNTTGTAETEDDVTVTTFGGSTSTETVRETEQAVEEATSGLAFGDSDVDEIGSGEGVSKVDTKSENGGSSSQAAASTASLPGPMAELPVSPIAAAAIGVGALGFLFVVVN
jgi:hypothetical protein